MRLFCYKSDGKLFSKLLFSLSLILITPLSAEPWIDTSDIYLKANIQLLADSGHITTPVTTYPLMWHDIINNIRAIDNNTLTPNQENAYLYITHQFKLTNQNRVTVKAQVATDNNLFTSFGDTFRDKNSLQIQSSYMSNNFAIKMAPSYFQSTEDDNDKFRLDDSYIATFIGNWVLSLGRQNRWYGPTWDTSLSLTNNARPITAISLNRKSALPLQIPFTDIEIPWTVSTFMGQMDDTRTIKNTLLWGFRLNVKPLKNLEIGISRLAQWGGEGRAQDFSMFWDVFLGKSNCGISGVVCNENTPNPANQQAGYDFRYSMNWFDIPVNLYAQKFAEDGNEKAYQFVTKAKLQVGLDAHFNLFSVPSTVFIEYSDSLADCGTRDNIGDCYYEHSSYTTGMRYYGRTIGSLYDNDAETVVLGAISQFTPNTHVTTKFRWLALNKDNSDKAPNNPLIGNSLTKIAKDTAMLSTSIRHSIKNWRFTLDAAVSHSTYDNDVSNENDVTASLTVEYNL